MEQVADPEQQKDEGLLDEQSDDEEDESYDDVDLESNLNEYRRHVRGLPKVSELALEKDLPESETRLIVFQELTSDEDESEGEEADGEDAQREGEEQQQQGDEEQQIERDADKNGNAAVVVAKIGERRSKRLKRSTAAEEEDAADDALQELKDALPEEEDEEKRAAEEAAKEGKPVKMEESDDNSEGVGDGEEDLEIDGVQMTLKRGRGFAPKTLEQVIDAIQANIGQPVLGYDLDDEFIDDEDMAENPEEQLREKHEYRYEHFFMDSKFELPRLVNTQAVAAAGGSKRARPLKNLNDLSPAPTQELRDAIEAFRQACKAIPEEKLQAKRFPELDEPLLRLGKAIMSWHPKQFIKEEIFEYVRDVVPPNVGNLKTRARTLLQRAGLIGSAPPGGAGGAAPAPNAFPQQFLSPASVLGDDVMSQSFSQVEDSVIPGFPQTPLAADDQRFLALKAKLQAEIEEQQGMVDPNTKGRGFKMSQQAKQMFIELRQTLSRGGVVSLNNELLAMFPEGWMKRETLNRLGKPSDGGSKKKAKLEVVEIE